MNKLIKRALLLLIGLAGATMAANAQGPMPQVQPMPLDTAVRYGKLPNGLTYYIRHNELPKGQADFYIAQKVGSILEEESQRGLAHFLEHMCFNGTRNFPGNSLIDWLESVGVKFGRNLNAYTSIDETVYNISNVPTERTSVQDSVLLILHDWAGDLTLDPEEIDKERGVIHEEWRTTNKGSMRILEQQLPKIFPNNRYGERLPIGLMSVVDNFPPKEIVDYYHTWYRPDQQGIVVVGDIDVDYIEGKIKEMFADHKMPENAKERQYFPVEDTPGTIYAIGKDKEMDNATAIIAVKYDKLIPRELNNTAMYFPIDFMTSMVTSMMNSRLSDISQKPDAPFASAGFDMGDFIVAKTKDAVMMQVVAKGNDIQPAIEAAYRELLRAVKGGFTPGEYERAKAEYAANIEQAYNSRNTRQNGSYVQEYVRHFIDGIPAPGIEMEKQIADGIAAMLPLEQINMLLPELVKADNRVVLTMLPDNGEYVIPTEEQLAAVLAKVDAEDIEIYKDQMKSEPLIPALPAPGKIVSEENDSKWGATVLTLSNGVKVLVKPTKFKDNEIVFNAIAHKGLADFDDSNASNIVMLTQAPMRNGLGEYSNSDLQKYLQGKKADVEFSFSDYSTEVEGSSTPKDLANLMELIYMSFTNFDIKADEYEALKNMLIGALANQESTPDYFFSKTVTEKLFESPARGALSTAHIKASDRDASNNIVRTLTKNAADYTFIFVGDIDMTTFKPLVEQYIATLPADAATAGVRTAFNSSREIRPGSATDTETVKMETPQTYVLLAVTGKSDYTPANSTIASIAGQILSNRLLKKVREEMGAVYSIGAQGMLSRNSQTNTVFQSAFPMKPEKKDEVLALIRTMFEDMGKTVTADELNPIKEYMVKTAKENAETNSGWLAAMSGAALNGVDSFNNIVDVINSITTDDVMNFMRSVLEQGNYRVVVVDPAAN